MLKSTYGTGCFALLNTGDKPVMSRNRLLTTIAYQLDGKRTYALEGSIFVAGAAVQWLRDGLGIIRHAGGIAGAGACRRSRRTASISFRRSSGSARRTGTPRPAARSSASPAARRGPRSPAPRSKSVCYQTRDLLEAMRGDWDGPAGAGTVLRVDGGMVASDWTMQFLADILGAPVDRPKILETTALGAAYLAGLEAGLYPPPAEFAKTWKYERRFKPKMRDAERDALYAGWQRAVARTLARP